MPERDSRPRKKAGLHGWRAFLVVVGSGLTAGILIIALIVGALRLFVSTVQGGTQQQPPAGDTAPTRGPVASLEPGSFDLCDSLENMQAFSAVAPERTDDGNSFIDTAQDNPGKKLRTIENTCVWGVQVGGLVPSELTFSYTSYMSDHPSVSADKRAVDRFDENKEETGKSIEKVATQGSLGGLEQGSYYSFGADGGEKKIAYVGMVKTSVFTVDITSAGADPAAQESDLEAEYKALIIELLPDVRVRLNRVIPD